MNNHFVKGNVVQFNRFFRVFFKYKLYSARYMAGSAAREAACEQ